MLGRAWRTFLGLLATLGLAGAAAVRWRDLVAHHPVVAVVLAGIWVVVVGAWIALGKAIAVPARRRLERAGEALDQAVGRWVSGYGRRYRQWVLDSRRYVDVKGLAIVGDHTPQLDDVYVDVALALRAPQKVSGDPLGDVPEDVTERYSIHRFLDPATPTVLALVGAPGTGKSTLLAHIARRSAHVRYGGRRSVPILLLLRDHASRVVADSAVTLVDLVRQAVSDVPAIEPAEWWERQLHRGRCVVLLDGLDEVADEQDRRTIADWIYRQINRYPRNHFVITSRPYGYRGAVIPQAHVLQVRPFSSEQVERFLRGWYLATERHAASAGDGKKEMRAVRSRAEEGASDLLQRLRTTPALHDLSVNPLLLTMIANVHRHRGLLPGSRADLYGEVCRVMLSGRLQAKNLPEYVPWPVKEQLLAQLAFEMMTRRVRDLPRDEVLQILQTGVDRLSLTISAQEFLRDVSSNGLLVEREHGLYAFVHLTFQEYLAARHVREMALVGTLAQAVDDDWWRETILLYAGADDAG